MHHPHARDATQGRIRDRLSAGVLLVVTLLAWLGASGGRAHGQADAFPPTVRQPLELENWPELLQALNGEPLTNATLRLLTVRALCETGRLPEELFARIHQSGPELLSTSGLQSYAGAAHLAGALLQIGYLNGAERLAFDSMEMEGENPSALRTLARLHAVRGLTNAARIFLNRLATYPGQLPWVSAFRAALETNSPAGAEPSLTRVRANLLTRDRIVSGLNTERVLRLALEANPTNRLAFEFLLAHQLLNRDLLPACSSLAKSPLVREGPLPRHYAEAVLLHRSLHPGIALAPLLPRVPPAEITRFERFQGMMKGAAGAPEKVQSQAWRDFADTYWYYYFFGNSPPPPSTTRPGEG